MPHRYVKSGGLETLVSSAGLIAVYLMVIPIALLPFEADTQLGLSLVAYVLIGAGVQIPIVHYQLHFLWIIAINLIVGVSAGYVIFIHGELFAPTWSREFVNELVNTFQAHWSEFEVLVPPIEPVLGFVVPVAGFLWLILTFSFQAAVRFRSSISAIIPLIMFVGVLTVLSRDTPSNAAAFCAIFGFVIYGFAQRFRYYRLWSKLAPDDLHGRVGLGSTARSMLIAALVAIVALLAIPPLDSHFDVRGLNRNGAPSAPRTVNSPMVGLRNLLGAQSNAELFTVSANQPAYWRLTALDEYDADRDLWVSTSRYSHPNSDSRSTQPESDDHVIIQDYTITGLAGIWLPTAFVPKTVTAPFEVRSNSDTSSFIVASDVTPSGATTDAPLRNQRYQVESTFVSSDTVTANDHPFTPNFADELQSPEISTEVHQLLRLSVGYSEAMTTSTTEIEFLRNLQDWFRDEFVYNENVDFSRASDPLAAFLTAGEGFCQQFSSAFALIAQAHGFDVRVAVGFTPGEADWDNSTSDRTTYVVKGKYAHAWPEVLIDGVGWVPFEPTPTRGNPLAEQITGVPAAQHNPDQDGLTEEQEPGDDPDHSATESPSTTSTTVPTQEPDQPQVPAPNEAPDQTAAPTSPESNDDPDNAGTPWLRNSLLLTLVAVIIAGVVVAVIRRGRQATHIPKHDNDAAQQWDALATSLSRFGVHTTPATTPLQLVDLLTTRLQATQRALQQMDQTRTQTATQESATPEPSTRESATAQSQERTVLQQQILTMQSALPRLVEAATIESLRRFGPHPLHEEQANRLAQLTQEIISLDPSAVAVDDEAHLASHHLGV